MVDRTMLRYMRQNAGVSTKELADIIGFRQSYVSMVETGKRRVSDEYLKRVLKVFDFTIQDFN